MTRKAHTEFFAVNMESGWSVPPAYPEGMEVKILSGGLDERNQRGSMTRLVRYEPGVYTTAPFIHDFWEEVYVISGELIVGNDENGEGGEAFPANTYACRPPGVTYGPFGSRKGCLLLEIHYYESL